MRQTAKTVQFSAGMRSEQFGMITKKEMNEIMQKMKEIKTVNSIQMSLRQ